MQRREFMSGAAAAAAALASASSIAAGQAAGNKEEESPMTEPTSKSAASRIPRVTNAGTMKGEMLYRDLGATGVQVSVIGMGAAHLGLADVEEADRKSVV